MALNRTGAARVLPALGLANVAIVSLTMASIHPTPTQTPKLPLVFRDILVTVLASIALFFLLNSTNHRIGSFFSSRYVLFAAIFAGFLVSLLINGRSRLLALCLVGSQAIVFGTVNPVMHGLRVITSSQLYTFVRSHPEVLNGKWIVFSDSVVNSGFFAATGCEVYTGTRYLPDVDHFPIFRAAHIDTQKLNRLGFLDAHLRKTDEKIQVEVPETVVMKWDVRPNDQIVRDLGIRYVALDSRPPDKAELGLVRLASGPVDGFWLYRLP